MFAHGAVAGLTTALGQGAPHPAHGKFFNIFLVTLDALRAAVDERSAFEFGIELDPIRRGHVTVDLGRPARSHIVQGPQDYQ